MSINSVEKSNKTCDFWLLTQTAKLLRFSFFYPLGKTISALYRNKIFSQVMFTSGNFGNLKHLPWYLFKGKQGEHTDLNLDPTGGACYGACLFLAKTYFDSGKKIESLAKVAGDSQFEGVLLQSAFEKIESHCSAAELVSLKVTWLAPIGSNLALFSADEVIEKIPQLENGLYMLSIPCIVFKIYSRHALIMIKEENATYFYDPNFGFGKEKDLPAFLNRIFSFYQTRLAQQKSKIHFSQLTP